MTRTCHAPSLGKLKIAGFLSKLTPSNGHGAAVSSRFSGWPSTTQLCVIGSRRISMKGGQRRSRRATILRRRRVGTREAADCERGGASTMRSSLLAVQGFVKKSRTMRVLSSRANGTPFDGPPLMERDVEFMQIALEEARSAAA